MNVPRINWLQLVMLPVVIAIMVTAWFEPWVHWVVHSTGVSRARLVPSPLIMVAVILFSTVATRYALRRSRRPQRPILLGGGLALIAVAWLTYPATFPIEYLRGLINWENSIAPEVIVLIATAMLWWRGILIGRSGSLIDDGLERTFFNGILALALLVFLNNFTRYVPPSDMLAAVLVFFATALSALTVIGIERTRIQQHEPSSWLKRQRHWLGTIVAVVGAILLGAIAITGILSPEVLQQFLSALGPALSNVGNLIVAILRPLFTFLFWLITPLVPLLQAILRIVLEGLVGVLSLLHQLGVQINALKAQQQIETFLDSPEFIAISRGTSIVLILILFALIAIWALRRSGLLSRKDLDETRESIASRELFLSQLKSLLAHWRTRPPAVPPRYLALDGDDPRTVVRRAYQNMLDLARVRVGERPAHQTPAMYAAALTTAIPAQRDSITALTTTYERARYASESITAADADTARDALARLQSVAMIQSSSSEE